MGRGVIRSGREARVEGVIRSGREARVEGVIRSGREARVDWARGWSGGMIGLGREAGWVWVLLFMLLLLGRRLLFSVWLRGISTFTFTVNYERMK